MQNKICYCNISLVFCTQNERKEKLSDVFFVLSKMKAIKTQCENKNCDGHYLLFVLI